MGEGDGWVMQAVLLIETSTDKGSVALARDRKVVEEFSFTSDRRHNALLFEPLSKLIESMGCVNFDAVLVGTGPGSYSGTRVGIAAAQGAALVAGCKAVGVPSVLATAEACSGKACMCVGDARRGAFWTAAIDEGSLAEGPDLTDEIGLGSAMERAEAGGRAVFCMDEIRGQNTTISYPTAAGLWAAWNTASPQTRVTWAGSVAQPIYLKPPHITPAGKGVMSR